MTNVFSVVFQPKINLRLKISQKNTRHLGLKGLNTHCIFSINIFGNTHCGVVRYIKLIIKIEYSLKLNPNKCICGFST